MQASQIYSGVRIKNKKADIRIAGDVLIGSVKEFFKSVPVNFCNRDFSRLHYHLQTVLPARINKRLGYRVVIICTDIPVLYSRRVLCSCIIEDIVIDHRKRDQRIILSIILIGDTNCGRSFA